MYDNDEIIRFHFNGRLADLHQMNYYELARFNYGASRFLLKLAHFRNSGRVLQRVSGSIDADFRVGIYQQGSFIETIIEKTKNVIHQTAELKIPIKGLMSVVGNMLNKKTDSMSYLQKIKEAEAVTETEKTKQLEIQANLTQVAMVEAFKSKDRFLEYVIRENETMKREFAEETELYRTSCDFQQALESKISADRYFTRYRSEFDKVGVERLEQVLMANKGALQDMAVPVNGVSATGLSGGDDREKNFFYINEDIARSMSEEETDLMPTLLYGRIKSFDFETGWGKFRNEVFPNAISFQVPSFKKSDEKFKVIRAAEKGEGTFSFYYVKSKNGVVTKLILDRVVDADDNGAI